MLKRDFIDSFFEFLTILTNLLWFFVPILVGSLIWGWRPTLFTGSCVILCALCVALIVFTISDEDKI